MFSIWYRFSYSLLVKYVPHSAYAGDNTTVEIVSGVTMGIEDAPSAGISNCVCYRRLPVVSLLLLTVRAKGNFLCCNKQNKKR